MRFVRRTVQLGMLSLAAVQLASLLQAVHPVFDSLSQFRLHYSLLLAVGLLVLLLMKSWRVAGVIAAAIAAGLIAILPVTSHAGHSPGQGRQFTLVQFNTLYKNPTPEAIITQITAVNADAVTLQEAAPRNTYIILDKLKAEYPYQRFCGYAAVAVLSRWPAVDEGCAPKNGFGWMKLDVDGHMVTVGSLHLQWPWPFRQAETVAELEPVFRALPQPLIIGGDFNSAPWTHTLARVTEMTSTSLAGGIRLSLTARAFGLGGWPVLPIDHVLLPAGATADVTIGEDAGSDHLPVIARIVLP
jgi:endonuclease/exonuclease/phosphatase (EEP) superfamily protein YafD